MLDRPIRLERRLTATERLDRRDRQPVRAFLRRWQHAIGWSAAVLLGLAFWSAVALLIRWLT